MRFRPFFILPFILLLAACEMKPTEDVEIPACTGPGGELQLDCPAPPDIPQAPSQPDYDYFSWNTFIALNWPAVEPTEANSYARGFPDSGKHFTDTRAGDLDSLVVWETWKEKREIFDHGPEAGVVTPNPTPPGKWRQAVDYLGNSDGSIENCPGVGETPAHEVLFQSSKALPNSLDETLEVLSEALETPAELCRGYEDSTKYPNKSKFCKESVPGAAVAPLVWKGLPTDPEPQPIRYEVKVNYDFFKYVVDTTITSKTASYSELYKDSVKQAAMQDPEAPLRLPFRSNSTTGPDGSDQGGPNQNAVLGYQALKCEEHNESGPGEPGVNPCLMGAVHTKAAWIPLYDEEEYASYYTKRALYYVTKDGKTQCEERVFGLVGFHIIQRVHQSAGEKGVGGTFIFSSWEHKEVAEGGYYYVNYWDGRPLDAPGSAGFYPNPAAEDGPLPVTRQVNTVLKNTDEVNEVVWDKIRAINPQSPWLNYRLIGTQFLPVDLNAPRTAPESETPYPVSENDPLGIGQPQFMANLVIETNLGLQHFQGEPPLTVVNQNFLNTEPLHCPEALQDGKCPKSIQSNTSASFMRDAYNLAFGTLVEDGSTQSIKKKANNMGGCMGCHGVSELRGATFSFVLLAGQAGADADTEKEFTEQPPPSVP